MTFQVLCEAAFYVDHVRTVVDKIGAVASDLPAGDSRHNAVSPALLFQAGELIGYTGGSSDYGNWDFGVLNTEVWNPLPETLYNRSPNIDKYRYAVCPYQYYDVQMRAHYTELLGDEGGGAARVRRLVWNFFHHPRAQLDVERGQDLSHQQVVAD